MSDKWENRIVSRGYANPADLAANPLNMRTHPAYQSDALRGALSEIGWVSGVCANLRTSDDWPDGERNVVTLVDGHDRVAQALANGVEQVPVRYVDLSPEEERLALMVFDQTTELADRDHDRLEDLIDELQIDDPALRLIVDDLAKAEGISVDVPPPPSLDDLAAEYGEPDPTATWPLLQVRVAPETYELWERLMDLAPAPTDAHRVDLILDQVQHEQLGIDPPQPADTAPWDILAL